MSYKLSGKNNDLRLQVFLSRNGVCSRREAMSIIQQGHVKVNGKVVFEPSVQINPQKDKIRFNGVVVAVKAYEYIMLHKPAGYVTTKEDQFAKKTVFDLLPPKLSHLVPVGRLDKDTEGLLLLTNDGDTVYRLTHPKFDLDKVYFAQISGKLEVATRKRVEQGVVIDRKMTAPASIRSVKFLKGKTALFITIHEGRKRQIRLMFAKVGHRVAYLKRLAQGSIKLGDLKIGKWRKLTPQEIEGIKK
ncbi:Ribosomal small subunit pseudouridine synthase A [hydrothermal vent metagenome]|uniref:Ribosomal small subunit pseudouridine synthase A n=1 Tax=hydrothermal vent metagenome TaxID=652676 RepID=A0A3B1DKH6_9ZZZZ